VLAAIGAVTRLDEDDDDPHAPPDAERRRRFEPGTQEFES
jgi:hypothetical protein